MALGAHPPPLENDSKSVRKWKTWNCLETDRSFSIKRSPVTILILENSLTICSSCLWNFGYGFYYLIYSQYGPGP